MKILIWSGTGILSQKESILHFRFPLRELFYLEADCASQMLQTCGVKLWAKLILPVIPFTRERRKCIMTSDAYTGGMV